MNHKTLFVSLAALAAAPAFGQTAPAATAQAQAPQPVTKAVFIQRIDSAFASVDGNRDGSLDRAEVETDLTKAMTQRKAAVISERERAFRQLDADKNGTLTLTEFNSAIAAIALPKANAAPVFNELDGNKDGKISAAENRAPRLAQFDRADADKNGSLSPQEQRAAAQASR